MERDYLARDMSQRDLRGFDLRDQLLFGADFRGSNLRGAHLTMQCASFDGVKFDADQVALMLLMFHLADLEPSWRQSLRRAALEIVGAERMAAIERYLRVIG